MTPSSDMAGYVETHGLTQHVVDAFGTRINVVEQGEGPLVLFVHGFPESWFSWRHQLPAVAAAGYRAAAIDVRGYGRSAAPLGVEPYGMVHHAADNVGVVRALGEEQAIIVGHDWGSPIAWNSALLHPSVFRGLAILSVPYNPRGPRRPSEAFRVMAGAEEFYIEYFQEVGRAEAEIEVDLARWLLGFYISASGSAPPMEAGGGTMATVAPGGKLSDRFRWLPEGDWPDWLSAADFACYLGEFERTGLTGGLNRYRNADRDWVDLRGWTGAPIGQPSLFVGGEKDGPTIWGAPAIENFPNTMPNLYKSVIVAGSGHWVQQEAPDLVNAELVEWLGSVDG
ncbi:MAG: alpha/beta hydrolase [Actinomycetia bacterium]|nr:alpha/beta hydrolase [Actinomycetes bacterium]